MIPSHNACRHLARSLSALCCGLLLALPAEAARLALVMGNDQYLSVTPLKNARADAQAMAQALKQTKYEVDLRLDLKLRDMQSAVREFKNKIKPGDEVVIFFSGHGLQIEGSNFLLPIDINVDNAEQAKDDAVSLQRVLDDLSDRKARFSLMIIDACRNNPFKGRGRALTRAGLAPTSAANGQVIVYSAGTDQQALDRLGENDPVRNGVFTRVFVQEMLTPGLTIQQVLGNVRERVVEMALSVKHDQVPAIYDQAVGRFYFVPGTAPTASVSDPAAAEIAMWTAVKDSSDPLELRSYLNLYPKGRFAESANARLAKLGGGGQQRGAVLAEPGKTFKECEVCPDMVVVPEGKLRLAASRIGGAGSGMGEIDLQRRFGVGRFEITFDEWDACHGDGGCSHKPGDEGWGRGKQPVVNVSLRDASDYVDWLSRKTGAHYRLLREAEWEYVAAAGASTRYPWGDTTGSGNANCDGCGSGPSERVRTVQVGKFGRNRFGLFDVIGNAWELVDDCYSAGVKAVDPNAKSMAMECQTAVARGGSFNTPVGDATLQRRREVGADVRSNQNSFRVARDLP